MNYYIPKNLYRSMDSGLLLKLLRELGRQGKACGLVLDVLARGRLVRQEAA
jgi:hypothetical protein